METGEEIEVSIRGKSGRANQIQVDVHSDFVCPWCFVGSRRLRAALDSFGDEVDVVTRHHPYLLYPSAPIDGFDLTSLFLQRYRQVPERMFDVVEAAGQDAGISPGFSKVMRVYSTVDAHTLVRHAERKGTDRALVDAIFTAYFLEGRNIGDRQELASIAVRHGFTDGEARGLLEDEGERLRTRDEAARTIQSGVIGVPFYVINDREHISGARHASVFRDAIERALAAGA